MKPSLHRIFISIREMEKFNLAKTVRLIPMHNESNGKKHKTRRKHLYENVSYIYTEYYFGKLAVNAWYSETYLACLLCLCVSLNKHKIHKSNLSHTTEEINIRFQSLLGGLQESQPSADERAIVYKFIFQFPLLGVNRVNTCVAPYMNQAPTL